MPVTDEIVEIVRSYLTVDKDRFRRLLDELDDTREMNIAYKAMIMGAFIAAVDRKFDERSSREEVIDYVADLRSRGEDMPDVLDPDATERMIMCVFTDVNIDDIDADAKVIIEMHVATAIVNDDGLRDEALDEFMAEARKQANELLG